MTEFTTAEYLLSIALLGISFAGFAHTRFQLARRRG
jgi:hypothetical protein